VEATTETRTLADTGGLGRHRRLRAHLRRFARNDRRGFLTVGVLLAP
jgi:hypothetical protein